MTPDRHSPIQERDRREIAALADGTLRGARRDAVEARVRADSELAALLAEQEFAVAALRAVDVRAPGRLRMAVGPAYPRPRAFRRPAFGLGLAGAAAAVAVALVLALPGGAPGGPSVVQAAALGARAATLPAPAVDAGRPELLMRAIAGISFPNWAPKFGWRATGVRSDKLRGHTAVTVFYADRAGRRLAYTIVGGRALPRPGQGSRLSRGGVAFSALDAQGRRVVTWERSGHTCVLSAAGVDVDALLGLASYVAPTGREY